VSEAPLLQVNHLTKVFIAGMLSKRQVKAVDDVSFEVKGEKPQITALVGESGSGKSTILRTILGFIKPSSGEVLYKGKNVFELLKKDRKTFRKEVQAIFQDPYSIYNPFYRVDRVLELVMKNFEIDPGKDRKALIEEALRKVGIRPEELLGRYPHQISGGERQRLMLARILLIKPRLLLADEPVSMIDASLRAIFLDILLDFKKKYDISSVYVTHDFNVAHYVADDVVVLCNGNVVEKGTINEIVSEPLHPYTKNLIRSIPIPDPTKRWEDKIELKVTDLKSRIKAQGCIYCNRCLEVCEGCADKKPVLKKVGKDREVACLKFD